MSLFNSLGSNYNLRFALRSLFAAGDAGASRALVDKLEDKYGGKAELYASGRQALRAALDAIDDQDALVIINGFTCYAVYEAAELAGKKIGFADINTEKLHFDAKTLADSLNKYPEAKAVIVQNTLGYPCDITEIEKLCREQDLILIEDLAHSIGTVYLDGREAGTVGDMVMLSFGRDKIVDAVAGGALVIRDSRLGSAAKGEHLPGFWRQWVDRWYPLHTQLVRWLFPIKLGQLLQVFWQKFGLMPRSVDGDSSQLLDLPPWQANLVLYQFARLEKTATHRARIADIYHETLDKAYHVPDIARYGNHSSNLRFPLFVQDRDSLLQHLKRQGIYLADIWYDVPIAPGRYLDKTNYRSGECQAAETATGQLLNLPTHINVSIAQAERLVNILNSWIKEKVA